MRNPAQRRNDDSIEAERIINFLVGMPGGDVTATLAVVRTIMLRTGGWIMASGSLYDIKAKSLGGGVSRLTLEKRL